MPDTGYPWPIEWTRLGNGLRVVVSPDEAAPIAAVNLWYDVGSRHEPEGQTGFAHLFEHLMFEGSVHAKKTEHMRLIQGCGGSLNATTNPDRTNYFETVPAEHLELALWLEADRMGGLVPALVQDTLDNQREVVKNERRQRYDNVPYGDA
ncbi:MAG TPA: insulinase family protein, partial [Micromonosporaceae bacterium]|nr:insulinase family protein [Micromonosporaceae bacterium]